MKPSTILDRFCTPDGSELVLHVRDGVFTIRVNGLELMSSRAHGSEQALARCALDEAKDREAPRVLVGGLGMGFTLRAALDALPQSAAIDVAEVFERVVAWNRGVLARLADDPLNDRRVVVRIEDVADTVAAARGGVYDAILLDVDNGPSALTLARNQRLYGDAGLRRLSQALTPAGALALWSAAPDRSFERRVRKAGFCLRRESIRAHASKGARHTVYVATKARRV